MSDRTIPYCRPLLGPDEIAAVAECMRNGWLTTGPKVKQFEHAFASASGSKHAIALNSCTAGLHLALAALGVGPGDEVVMPSLTFVAGAQCVCHLGATPVFADVDPETLCVTRKTIQPVLTSRTKVIIPMQYGGAPLDIEPILSLAEDNNIRIIEDAAHAMGTLDSKGEWAGARSAGASYSFYATKNITTAEGGMFLTNDDDVADTVRVLSLHGMDKDAWKRYTLGSKYSYDVVAIGYKYNMSDMMAATGIVQLSKLGDLQKKRDELAALYFDALEKVGAVRPIAYWPKSPGRHSWCVFAVLIDTDIGITRDAVIEKLAACGVGTSVHFIPTHQLSAFRTAPHGALPVTEWAAEKLISLPLYPGMSIEDAAYVVAMLKSIVSKTSQRP